MSLLSRVPEDPKRPKYLEAQEAAARLGISQPRLRQLVIQGRVPVAAETIWRRLYSEEGLAAFEATRLRRKHTDGPAGEPGRVSAGR